MSIGYSCGVVLKTKFLKENIKNILENGARLDFIYYENYFEKVIEVDVALQCILNCSRKKPNFICTKIQDTIVNIIFEKENKNLKINFALLSDYWIKRRNETEDNVVDIARYLKILFKLCENFKIKKIDFSYF